MNSRGFAVRAGWTLALTAGLASPFACGGKVVFVAEADGGAGGHGGASSSTTSSSSSTGTSTAGSTGVGGFSTGSSSGTPTCSHCASAFNDWLNGGSPGVLCPGAAQSAFDTLNSCGCATGCPASCGDNLCAMGTASADCVACLNSTCSGALSGCVSN